MCLTVLAWNHDPRWRVLLVGNRDEFHARPTAPLARWTSPGGPAVLAGRDLQSGGTWMGLANSGRCAVVTNFRAPQAELRAGTSRGSLPLDFLGGCQSARARGQAVLAEARQYSPFNLLLIDESHCMHVDNHPAATSRSLQPGLHGISNGGLDLPWPKTMRLGAALDAWLRSGSEDLTPLWRALADESLPADHELPDTGVGLELERMLAPVFIRDATYGTRASTVVAIDHKGRGWISERRFGPDGVFEGETTLHMEA